MLKLFIVSAVMHHGWTQCDGMCLPHDDVVVESNTTWNKDQSYMGAVVDRVSYSYTHILLGIKTSHTWVQ